MRHLIAQALCALVLLAGVYLLAGIAWALVLAGAAGLAVATLVELLPPRTRRPATED